MSQSLSRNSGGGTFLKVLSIGAVVMLFGLAIYGIYIWRYNDVHKLHKQVEQLQSQLEAAKSAPSSTTTYTSVKGIALKVYIPQSNAQVSSPVAVVGEVPGSWSFEGSFPVKLKDASGNIVAQGTAELLSEWTTDQLVPFSAKLTYSGNFSGSGTLVLQKDNQSGEARFEDSVEIPIKF